MTPEAIRSLSKAVALVSVCGGAYGMLLCVPIIISASAAWTVAASLPFVAGAVLVSGGLVSYTLLIRKEA